MINTKALNIACGFQYLEAGERAFVNGITKMSSVVKNMTAQMASNMEKMQSKMLISSQKSLATIGGTFSRISDLFNNKEQAFEDVMMAAFQMSAIGSNIARRSFQLFQGMIGKSLDIAAEFEEGMVKLKFVTEATREELSKLSKEATILGIATQWTPLEVLDAMKKLGSAGLRTRQILETIEPVLNFATISEGKVNLDEAARLLAATLNKFNLETSQSAKVVDMFAETINNALLDADHMIEFIRSLQAMPAMYDQVLQTTLPIAIGLSGIGKTAAESGQMITNFGRRMAIVISMLTGGMKRAYGGAIIKLAKSLDFENIISYIGEDGTKQFRKFTDVAIFLNRQLKAMFPGDTVMQASAAVRLLTEHGATLVKTLDKLHAEITVNTKSSAILKEVAAEGWEGITKNYQLLSKTGEIVKIQGEAVLKYYEKFLEKTEGIAKTQIKDLLKTWKGIRLLMKGSIETIHKEMGTALLPTVKIIGMAFYERIIQPFTEFVAKRKAFVYIFQVIFSGIMLITAAAMSLVAIFGTMVATIWAIGHMFAKKEFLLFWTKTLFPKITALLKIASALTLIWLLDLGKIKTMFSIIGKALEHANKYIVMSHKNFQSAISVFLDVENSVKRISGKIKGTVDLNKKILTTTERWALQFTKIYLIASSILQQYRQGFFDYDTGKKIIAAGWKKDAEWWYDATRNIIAFFKGFAKGFIGFYKIVSWIVNVAIIFPIKIIITLWNKIVCLLREFGFNVNKIEIHKFITIASILGTIVGTIFGLLTIGKVINFISSGFKSLYKTLVLGKDVIKYIFAKILENAIGSWKGLIKISKTFITFMQKDFLLIFGNTMNTIKIFSMKMIKLMGGFILKFTSSIAGKLGFENVSESLYILYRKWSFYWGKMIYNAKKGKFLSEIWKKIAPHSGWIGRQFFYWEKGIRAAIANMLTKLVSGKFASRVDMIIKKHFSDRVMKYLNKTSKWWENVKEKGILKSIGDVIKNTTKSIYANTIALWVNTKALWTNRKMIWANILAWLQLKKIKITMMLSNLTTYIWRNTKALIVNIAMWTLYKIKALWSLITMLPRCISLMSIYVATWIALAKAQIIALATNPWALSAMAIVAIIALVIIFRKELIKIGEVIKDSIVGSLANFVDNLKYIIENLGYLKEGVKLSIKESLAPPNRLFHSTIPAATPGLENIWKNLNIGSPFHIPIIVEKSSKEITTPLTPMASPTKVINVGGVNYHIKIDRTYGDDIALAEKIRQVLHKMSIEKAIRD